MRNSLERLADLASWPRWLYVPGVVGVALASLGLLVDAVTAADWILTPVFGLLAVAFAFMTLRIIDLRRSGIHRPKG